VPLIAVLYFVNYLDRTNISFAKLSMNDALGMDEAAYGFAAGVFFLGYLLFQVPSNLALSRFGARRWMATIVLAWGVLATLLAFVPNLTVLSILRFFLGVAEAGLFPGAVMYLAIWFPKQYRAQMISWFMLAIPISSVIGAPLSTYIMEATHGLLGHDGWRIMFLVEGIPAVLLAFVVLRVLTDTPKDAAWLRADERAALVATLAEEEAAVTREHRKLTIGQALLNGRVLLIGLIGFGVLYGLYAVSFFMPTIVAGFSDLFNTKFSLIQTGLIVAIPFAVAGVGMILWSRHADRTREQVWHVAIPMTLGGIAVPVALYLGSPFAVMIALTITTAGVLMALPVFWSIPGNFLTGAALAGGFGVVNTVAQISGFIAPYVTGWAADLTGSNKTGLWIVGIAMVLSALLTVAIGAAPRPSRNASADRDASLHETPAAGLEATALD
jgi:MFS family permease